jgi:hypothetical protein
VVRLVNTAAAGMLAKKMLVYGRERKSTSLPAKAQRRKEELIKFGLLCVFAPLRETSFLNWQRVLTNSTSKLNNSSEIKSD